MKFFPARQRSTFARAARRSLRGDEAPLSMIGCHNNDTKGEVEAGPSALSCESGFLSPVFPSPVADKFQGEKLEKTRRALAPPAFCFSAPTSPFQVHPAAIDLLRVRSHPSRCFMGMRRAEKQTVTVSRGHDEETPSSPSDTCERV